MQDNLKDFMSNRHIDTDLIDLSNPVSMLGNGIALMMVKNKSLKKRLSIAQLRTVVSLCVKLNLRKLYLLTDNTLKNAYVTQFDTFKPYLDVEIVTFSFLLIKPGEMYLDKDISLLSDGREFMRKKGIMNPEKELSGLSVTDRHVVWYNMKKGDIVLVRDMQESYYRIVD